MTRQIHTYNNKNTWKNFITLPHHVVSEKIICTYLNIIHKESKPFGQTQNNFLQILKMKQ